jgi:hypothetical protein
MSSVFPLTGVLDTDLTTDELVRAMVRFHNSEVSIDSIPGAVAK